MTFTGIVKKFADKHSLDFTLLADEGRRCSRRSTTPRSSRL
jgi:peroxiredoxin